MTKFEADGADEVGLFIRGQRVKEKLSLVEMLLKL